MNKYTIRATAQVAGLLILGAVVSGTVSLVLSYLKPTVDEVIVGLGISAMAFVVYNLIQIRASALETADKLKELANK
jgi:hypothetical protein